MKYSFKTLSVFTFIFVSFSANSNPFKSNIYLTNKTKYIIEFIPGGTIINRSSTYSTKKEKNFFNKILKPNQTAFIFSMRRELYPGCWEYKKKFSIFAFSNSKPKNIQWATVKGSTIYNVSKKNKNTLIPAGGFYSSAKIQINKEFLKFIPPFSISNYFKKIYESVSLHAEVNTKLRFGSFYKDYYITITKK